LKELILVSGKDCHLCREAQLLLSQLNLKDCILTTVDIYSKRTYVDKYWDKIPVILYGEQVLLWPFDKEKVNKLLD
tara:strand:- start:232 stop:459 length:228 start_codon:yes stop_codon:yes gene_type:complete